MRRHPYVWNFSLNGSGPRVQSIHHTIHTMLCVYSSFLRKYILVLSTLQYCRMSISGLWLSVILDKMRARIYCNTKSLRFRKWTKQISVESSAYSENEHREQQRQLGGFWCKFKFFYWMHQKLTTSIDLKKPKTKWTSLQAWSRNECLSVDDWINNHWETW